MNQEEHLNIKPFTRWAGGKTRLIPVILENLPKKFNTYHEPFVGGGAVLFAIQPKKAIINDANSELILAYKAIKEQPDELMSLLLEHKKNDCKEYYLKIRAMDRENNFNDLSTVERAARLIYMLRVNFNGLYRVNSKNQFNTSYGLNRNVSMFDETNIRNIHEYLTENNIEMYNQDFSNVLDKAKHGDFVYLDPPYIPISKHSSFTRYTKDQFRYERQVELRDLVRELTKKGVYVMLSNSSSELSMELYKEFNIQYVKVNRTISCLSSSRTNVDEILVTNY